MKLFQHQIEALDKTKQYNKAAYYLDMGLGKTFIGSEKMDGLGESNNLIVCQKSKVEDWINHIKEHYPSYLVIDATVVSDVEIDDRKKVIISNYELLHRREWVKKLSNIPMTLIVDESSLIKNATRKRTKAIVNMRAKNIILLSGTPTGGKYEELYTQLSLLGWKITKETYLNTYTEYEWRYMGGFFKKYITGYKNVDRLKRKLREHGAIFMKTEDVLDLPEQIHVDTFVHRTKDYMKFMKDSVLIKPDKEFIGDNPLVKLLYARQLCGVYSESKLQAFKDLIDSTNDRIVVFYNFKDELKVMKQVIGDRPYSEINGECKDDSNFRKLENAILFVQFQAGARGGNYQESNKIIYYSLPLSSDEFEQSKKRIHRIGQNRTCFYYYLLTRNSVEMNIKKTLEMRKDYTDELFREEF